MANTTQVMPSFGDFMLGPKSLFQTLGLNIMGSGENIRKFTWWDWMYRGFILMEISWNISCMVGYLLLEEFETTIELTTVALYWTFASSSCIKGAWIVVQRHKIRKLFSIMTIDFPRTQQERTLYQLDAYHEKIIKYNKHLIVFHMLTTSMFNTFPLVQSIGEFSFTSGNNFPYYLPYMMSYPFDVHKPWGYFTAYVTQCLGAYSCSCLFLGTDLLTLNLLHLINMHLEFLHCEIVRFEPTGTDEDMRHLSRFVTFHQQLFIYNEQIEQILGVPNFVNYCSCTIMICLIALQIVMGSELWNVFKFLCFLIVTLVQLFFTTVFATTMRDMSTGIGDAFFEQPWYLSNIKYQRMLKFSLGRSQKPLNLTGLGFFTISMESFKTLMSTSYQFFTLIKRLEEEA